MTPAQATGHPTLDDVPVSGPTDPGIWSADCHFMQTVLPTPEKAACVDCKGPIPMWANHSTPHGVGEQISFGGRRARGFGIGKAGDPDAWVQLNAAQQTWVAGTLNKLNDLIVKQTGTSCPTWGPAIPAAAGCFQGWFNGAKLGLTGRDGAPITLRTDGVFDQDTLDALRTVAALNPKDFTTPFPGTEMAGTGSTKKLSTGAMVGIGVGGAAVLGGIVYAATRKGGRRKGRKASRRRR